MYVIGICGRSGSGKTTAAYFLRRFGAYNIDADAVCRAVYAENEECKAALCRHFGSDILSDCSINRAELAKRAFGTEGGIVALNKTVHGYICKEINRQLAECAAMGKRVVLIDAPLLYESGLDTVCDAVIAVISAHLSRVSRLEKRDGKSRRELTARLNAQLDDATLVERCDAIIVNRGTLAELRKATLCAMLAVQLKLGAVKRNRGKSYAIKTA